MSIVLTEVRTANIQVTIEGVNVGDDDTYNVTGISSSRTLTSATTPAVTKHSSFQKTLSSGLGTIDLTSLPDDQGTAAAVTLNGLKPHSLIFRNLAANANAITVAVGASNGYDGLGASFTITLQPGDEFRYSGTDGAGLTEISSSKKTFDLTGTGSQVLEVQVVAG